MTELHLDQLQRLVARALADGGQRLSAATFAWDISGSCRDPHAVELEAHPEASHGDREVTVSKDTTMPLWLSMRVPCRRCDRCLRYRSMLWTMRAKAEIGMSTRTWFGTLTLRPDWQFHALTTARGRAASKGIDFETLDPEEQFRRRCAVISSEITKWFKRVRKESGAPLRYLVVAERHKSGEPHWHLLLHETNLERTVKYAVLKKHWHLGHAMFKLVDDNKPAGYVCKYLTKASEARVRASLRYGIIRSDSLVRLLAAYVRPDPHPKKSFLCGTGQRSV